MKSQIKSELKAFGTLVLWIAGMLFGLWAVQQFIWLVAVGMGK